MDKNKHHSHYLVPLPVYFKTLVALLILTIVTVGASYIDFGKANIFVALGIASLKASLVMMFFMGLKYDTLINRAFILSSFLALGIFFFYCAIDLWTRKPGVPVKVTSVAAALSLDDLKALAKSTPEMLAKGKESYDVNCAVCHGPQGQGDGIGGAALNPHPRNFHAPAGEWKYGNSPEAIFATLTYGSPGTGMAAYKSISPQDRWALAHYVATFGQGEKITKAVELFEKAMKEESAGASAGTAGGASKTQIPVDFAIERMVEEKK